MIGHIRLCLEEIEAEIDEAGFSVLGARAREVLAEHISGIRCIMETVEAGLRSGSGRADQAAVSPGTELTPATCGQPMSKAA